MTPELAAVGGGARDEGQGKVGCQCAAQDSGEEVGLWWGEGEVKKRGWAKFERVLAGRKAVERKKK